MYASLFPPHPYVHPSMSYIAAASSSSPPPWPAPSAPSSPPWPSSACPGTAGSATEAISRYAIDGWTDGWMDGWMDGRMDGRMDECACMHPGLLSAPRGRAVDSTHHLSLSFIHWIMHARMHALGGRLLSEGPSLSGAVQTGAGGVAFGEPALIHTPVGRRGLIRLTPDTLHLSLYLPFPPPAPMRGRA